MALSNKDVVLRLYRQAWNERKLELIDQLIADTHALNDPTISGAAVGPQVYKRQIERFLHAFPDLQFVVEETINEHDKLVAVWTATGTHQGEFYGLAPTHKKGSISGITIHQIAGGKIIESTVIWDGLGLLQQLGVSLPLKPGVQVASGS
jgi:steroid delta-isomerase-like uncharacterized protein